MSPKNCKIILNTLLFWANRHLDSQELIALGNALDIIKSQNNEIHRLNQRLCVLEILVLKHNGEKA